MFKIILLLVYVSAVSCRPGIKDSPKQLNDSIEVVLKDSLKQMNESIDVVLKDSLKHLNESEELVLKESLGIGYTFPYSVNQPEEILILNSDLTEISGLTYDPVQDKLLAINDEAGFLFILDKNTGKILDRKKFAGPGDYEGIEFVDGIIYVVKSNGHIYSYKEGQKEYQEKVNTELTQANDVEGLGYDPISKQLIIACKGSAFLSKHQKKKSEKSIFGFDLASNTLILDPLLMVKDSSLQLYARTQMKGNMSKSELKKCESRLKDFSPSAIAINPESGYYYILSSVGKSLVVVDKKSQIVDVELLNSNIHYQPEGICFDNENRLYISNESKGLTSKIFGYTPKK